MIPDLAPIFERDDVVASRLRELGLDAANLTRAVEAGEAERRTCTKFDPNILGGVIAWGRTVRALRELLVPHGWKARDVLGLPLVVRSDGAFAVTVATGDHHTGLRGVPPQTKYGKGVAFPVTGERQLSMLADSDPLSGPSFPDDVWVLLLARTPIDLRSELSRPSHRNRNGTIGFSSERILLPRVEFDDPTPTYEEDEDFAVDVSVERL